MSPRDILHLMIIIARLFNAIVMSRLLCRSETWSMTTVNRRRLEAAHRRLLRRILHASWRHKITNETLREMTRQEDMENIIRKRRLQWLGHVLRMNKDRRANQVLHWVHEGRQRRGRPPKNGAETVKNDERPGNIMGEGGGAGDGQNRVKKMR